jgi:uncharacterized protein
MSVANSLRPALLALVASVFAAGSAAAQNVGVVTTPPGTLNHTIGTAVTKVLKEKANINALIQPTAGESVLTWLVGRGEAQLGVANILEVHNAAAGERGTATQPDLRLIGPIHALRVAFWVRKDAPMKSVADLKGKKVTLGYAKMPAIDTVVQSILATGSLTVKDVKPVQVANVIRGADDFTSGASDILFFAFGAPKVRQVDATIGIRALEIPESGMPAARKIFPYAYLSPAQPGSFFTGIDKPMGVYTYDNMLFTNAKVADDVVYKIIETLEANKSELIAVQPALREFSAASLYKDYKIPYHPGALKYFKDKGIQAKPAE